ncbi:hypothetical protein L596_022384 [Steinernema carpocapsae]|uniref:Uncharacterized protein n=1 Tax=Steinernema carpocapsae TaxID=34508 RepID=A0A4V6A067_STECR|nr:hypothetical protein L596_022384 [Steinernema carpocapsae]
MRSSQALSRFLPPSEQASFSSFFLQVSGRAFGSFPSIGSLSKQMSPSKIAFCLLLLFYAASIVDSITRGTRPTARKWTTPYVIKYNPNDYYDDYFEEKNINVKKRSKSDETTALSVALLVMLGIHS